MSRPAKLQAGSHDDRPTLCYSMVLYDSHADQCYEHEVDYLNAIATRVSLVIIVERGGQAPPVANAREIVVQKATNALARVIEHARVLWRIRRSGVTVFYARNSLINGVLAGLITVMLGGRNYFWSCGEVTKGWADDRRRGKWARALSNSLFFRLTLALSNGLVTGNATMKRYYMAAFALTDDKVKVIPNWISVDRFARRLSAGYQWRQQLQIAPETFVVLYPRSLSVRHGTYKLPAIIEKLVGLGVDACLVATGRGSCESELKSSFSAMNMNSRLRILGGIPNSQMPELLAAADSVIVPSDTEGFPRVILEAMAARVPFVASNVGGVIDVVSPDQTDILVRPDDLSGFASRLARLATDRDFAAKQTASGLQMVKRYAVETVVDEFVQLFSDDQCRNR